MREHYKFEKDTEGYLECLNWAMQFFLVGVPCWKKVSE